jgi:hypothetical protein
VRGLSHHQTTAPPPAFQKVETHYVNLSQGYAFSPASGGLPYRPTAQITQIGQPRSAFILSIVARSLHMK